LAVKLSLNRTKEKSRITFFLITLSAYLPINQPPFNKLNIPAPFQLLLYGLVRQANNAH